LHRSVFLRGDVRRELRAQIPSHPLGGVGLYQTLAIQENKYTHRHQAKHQLGAEQAELWFLEVVYDVRNYLGHGKIQRAPGYGKDNQKSDNTFISPQKRK